MAYVRPEPSDLTDSAVRSGILDRCEAAVRAFEEAQLPRIHDDRSACYLYVDLDRYLALLNNSASDVLIRHALVEHMRENVPALRRYEANKCTASNLCVSCNYVRQEVLCSN